MDEYRAIRTLLSRFPHKSEDYLRQKYNECNRNLNATIEAISNGEEEENSCGGFLDFLVTCIGSLCCCWDGPSYSDLQDRNRIESQNSRGITTTQASTQRVVTQEPSTVYREIANKHLQKKTELNKTALRYKKEGKTKLANQYFEDARLHGRLQEDANKQAVALIMNEHYIRNPRRDTIDFHGFYVNEAIQELDKFLDNHILELRQDIYNEIFLNVITGRGVHSADGIPKIKIAVIGRLGKRGLR